MKNEANYVVNVNIAKLSIGHSKAGLEEGHRVSENFSAITSK